MASTASASLQIPSSPSWAPTRAAPSPVHIEVGASSHVGYSRKRNEDQFYVTRMTRVLHTMLSSLPPGDVPERAHATNYVMVVADGVGGHAGGEIASRMAISECVELALDFPDWIFSADEAHAPEMKRRVREVIQQVGATMFEYGQRDSALCGMGSTLTIARICGRDLLIAHVGDTRAYLFRAGRLERMTNDETLAQLLVDTGRLSPDDADASGVRHILTNVLGGGTAQVEVAVDIRHLEDGDIVLLCSDGLTNCVDDGSIGKTLASGLSARACSRRLVRLALDRGGRDNITVVVAMLGFPTATAPANRRLRSLSSVAARLRERAVHAIGSP